MSTTQYGQQYSNACVFTVPIILHIPIQLQTEVSSVPQVCIQNSYSKQKLASETVV